MSDKAFPEAKLFDLKVMGGDLGSLVALESDNPIPFDIQRTYYIWGVPTNLLRGHHAHHAGLQFFICLRGSCRFMCDNGHSRQDFILDSPSKGLYVPAMIWGEQEYLSEDALALVLADAPYDDADYIKDYDEFVKLAT